MAGLVNIYVSREGSQSGPFTEAQLHSMLNAKLISPDDLAWREGQPAWETIREVLGLAEPPPLRPPPAPAAPQPNAEDQLRAKMRKKTAPSAVGGWLTFFCVGLTILGPLWSIGQLTETYEKAKPALDRFPTLKAAVNFETAGSVAILIYGFVVGCIIWGGSPSGRRIARQFLLIRLFGLIGIELIAFAMILPISSDAFSGASAEGVGGIVREIIYFLIWWFYFKKSERVRNTYGPDPT